MEGEDAARPRFLEAAEHDEGEGSQFTIERRGRLWALLDGDALVCLTAYRKGAVEVKRRLEGRGR